MSANTAELDEDRSLLIGSVVGGRYRVVRELARGGLGEVYEATHIELQRRVALKLLSGNIARDLETIKRFQREAQTASQIGHPNIVDVHDFGRTQDGLPYLAMEFLEGEDLDDHLAARGALPLARVIELLAPVASALDAVHARGIVHRDIKPANIFLASRIDGSEQIKLLDFGLAAFHERGDRLTQLGTVVGTPHYMPPEAAEGDLAGPRGDVYSLAVVAYECLSGVLPFDAEQATGILVKKVARPAPTMRARTRRPFPEALEEVLQLALDRQIDRRPATAGELVSMLREAMTSEAMTGEAPISMEMPTEEPSERSDVIASGSFEELPKRRTPMWLAIAIVLIVLTGGASGAWLAVGSGGSDGDEGSAARNTASDVATERSEIATSPARTDPAPEAIENAATDTLEAIPPEPGGATEPTATPPSPARPRRRRAGRDTAPSAIAEASPQQEEPALERPTAQPTPRATAASTDAPATPPRPQPPAPQPAGPQRDAATAAEQVRHARTALLRGQLASAASLFRAATHSDPENADAWRGLGLAQEQLEHGPEAIRAYRQYLRLAPGAPDRAVVRQHLERLQP